MLGEMDFELLDVCSFCSNLVKLSITVQKSRVLLKLLSTGWGFQETSKNDYFKDELRPGVGVGGWVIVKMKLMRSLTSRGLYATPFMVDT